ncbi:MAG: methylmalonyl-CoA epimerase [Spirochaetaceae bacterium]|nr:MAG: methylmalonyl-CoA epimerase [Spirochaetaceae bacterium]
MIRGIDHIGIAVRSLDERVPFYRDTLGLGEPEIEEVPEQKVRVAMFHTGAGRLELLEPTSPESPIAKFMEKNGEGIHHLALGTEDITGSIGAVEGAGLRMIDSVPREGAGGAQIAFVHPKSSGGVLLEFCRRG